MNDPSLPAGWYTDSEGGRRYWDGSTWLQSVDGVDPSAPSPARPMNVRKPWLWIGLASVAAVAIVGTCVYFVAVDRSDRAAEAQAAEVAAQEVRDTEKAEAIAAEEAAEAERIQADSDAAELELRKSAVTELEASVLKTAGERVESGLYGEPVLRASCMPVTGSSIEELDETSTTFSCLAITVENADGTANGYSMEAVVNWSTGQMTWG